MAETRLSDLGNLIYEGIDEVFSRSQQTPRNIYYKNCVREKAIDKKEGWYETIGSLGAAEKKAEGDVINFDKIEDGYKTTIVTETYSKGVKATIEALEFDLENVVQQTFGNPLTTKLIQKKEQVVADVYNNAFTNTGADGVAYISNSHPLINNPSKVNDNLLTGDLSNANIIAAKNMFNFIYDQSGEFFDTRPTHLLIHPAKMFLALQLLNSALMGLELSNTKNVLQDVMPIQIIENRYLDYDVDTDASPWFMLDKTLEAGVVLQTKGGTKLQTWIDNTDLTMKGVAYEMYGVGIVAPGFGIVGSAG